MSDALIDLHLHSTCSDGNESPRTVIEQAALHGLDVVALTDHDTTEGWAEAAAACAELGLTFVPGMELSATVPGGSVHILAYLFDPEEPALAAECLENMVGGVTLRLETRSVRIDTPLMRPAGQRLAQVGRRCGKPAVHRLGNIRQIDLAHQFLDRSDRCRRD